MRQMLPCLMFVAAVLAGPVAGEERVGGLPRWDVQLGIGLSSGLSSSEADHEPQRYSAPLLGAVAGRYWGDHWRTDVALAATRASEGYYFVCCEDPPSFYEYAYRHLGVSVAATYQFGRNAYWHPTLTAGVDMARESMYAADVRYGGNFTTAGGPRPVGGHVLSSTVIADGVQWRLVPYARAGLKRYISQRTYLSLEVKQPLAGGSGSRRSLSLGLGRSF